MAKKVLVIDDDESILDAISLILDDAGCVVDTTPNGEETLQKVRSFQPDIVLLDILISGTDGREICQTLKQNEKTKQIPVVMISAHPSAQSGAIASGADGFLAKPFPSEKLLSVVEEHTN